MENNMKIRILSDLHLEFGNLIITRLPDDHDTILVLAGDIHVGMKGLDFVDEMCERFKHVVYVLGNHEFYGTYVQITRDNWQVVAQAKANLTVMDNSYIILDDVLFLGGTLWTDVNKGDWFAKQRVKKGMHEFNGTIKHFNVEDAIYEHKITKEFILNTMCKFPDMKTVVVTHHMPHEECIMPPFAGSTLNPAFACTDMEEAFVLEPGLWIYGHTHMPTDINYNKTRLVCNPRGYCGYEHVSEYNQELVINV
jgi:predicted phosphodiesterase